MSMTEASEVSKCVGYTSSKHDALLFLTRPEVLQFVDFTGLIQIREVCKTFNNLIEKSPEELDYWKCVCRSYCFFAGVYSCAVLETTLRKIDHKKLFFTELWGMRSKWNNDNNGSSDLFGQEYKIKVANRFRPGEIQSDKVCLPLHQFLKVKRHQKAQQVSAVQNKSDSELLVGENDPEEFTDPLLGTLMKDPVLLPTSNRVVDRSVAVQCILRGGRDPFTAERLTMTMLIPQPELAQRIQEFKRKKQQWDVSLGVNELKPLLDSVAVDADLLEALLEVERINQVAHKAESEAELATSETVSTEDTLVEENKQPEVVGAADNQGPETLQAEAAAILDEAIAQAHLPTHSALDHLSSTDLEGHVNAISRKIERAGIVEINAQAASVCMHVPGAGVRPFYYSAVHPGETTQAQVYDKSAAEAIVAVLNGFNACIMCYGQTGSGKTHTFFGPDSALYADPITIASATSKQQKHQQEQQGIVLRACTELLAAKSALALNGINVSLSAQFVEIYEETVTDLLTGQVATIRRESGQVAGALETPFNTAEEVRTALRTGHDRKRFAATELNERSSRSHTALVIHVLQKLNADKIGQFATHGASGLCSALLSSVPIGDSTETASSGCDRMIKSQLHLVDLAGSERIKKSKVEGMRLREAVGINSSLLVLGKVISSLVKGKSHVPYYESKLTTLLKAAFGGNSRTTVIVNCRSDGDSGDETLQSMRFGERCAQISNSLRIAAQSFDTVCTAMDSALATVKEQLSQLEARNKQHLPSYKALRNSYQLLQHRRAELVDINAVNS